MGVIAAQLRLYLVTDPALCAGRGVVDTVRDAVRGGVTMVQLRDKDATTAERVALGRALMEVLAGTNIPLVINDDLEAAVAIGAHGVHVGQSDMLPHQARARLGRQAIVGLSCETVAHAVAADPSVLDYVGLGPVFATSTKPDHAAAMGLADLAAARAATPLPAVAIGGVQLANLEPVLATGVDGVAVVSAICGQPDAQAATRALAVAMARHMAPPTGTVS
jgi:thiamine-phosphate diphosphorylase